MWVYGLFFYPACKSRFSQYKVPPEFDKPAADLAWKNHGFFQSQKLVLVTKVSKKLYPNYFTFYISCYIFVKMLV